MTTPSKKVQICLLLLGFVMGYLVLWLCWMNGTVMASGRWDYMMRHSEIKVRRLPARAPIWALPLSFLPEDYGLYRFEYYDVRSDALYSAQSYSGDSFVATSAKVEWADGEATVYLNGNPIFRCDARGFWHPVR